MRAAQDIVPRQASTASGLRFRILPNSQLELCNFKHTVAGVIISNKHTNSRKSASNLIVTGATLFSLWVKADTVAAIKFTK
jgi:hypothetical protein